MQKGFSTLEILIAMTVLTLTLSSVVLVVFGNQSAVIDSELGAEALQKAQELLENEQALSRKDFKLVTPKATVTDGIYQKKIDVLQLSDFFTKKITSTVSWTSEHNRSKNISFSSVVTNFENAVGGDTCSSILSQDWSTPHISNFLLGTLLGDSTGSYPITDMDVYQKKLYVSVTAGSQSVGPNSPTAALNVSGSGGVSWNSPDNIKMGDSANSSSASSLNSIRTTDYLKATNFGFNIPQGATILGIKVEVERSRSGSGSGNIFDKEVKLVKADSSLSSLNKANTTSWPGSESYASYGSSSDLWNESWSPSAINDGNFGVVFSAKGSSGGSRFANVNHIKVTITYVKSFYVLDVSNLLNPTFISGLGSNSIGTGFKALAVATSSAGNFAYIATNAGPSSGQFQIIDLTPATPIATTTFIVPGVTGSGAQALGNTLFYKNGYIYLGLSKSATGPEFNIIDVRNPKDPNVVGSFSVGSGVKTIYVKENYAYLGIDDNSRELIVLDITNPLTPILLGVYDAPGSMGFGYGKSIYAVGDSVYFGRTYVSNAPEFTVLDASTTSLIPLGIRDIGPNSSNAYSVNGLVVRDYLAFLFTGSSSNGQFQILNVSNPRSVSSVFSTNLPSGGAGVALDCEGNYLYGASLPTDGKGSISIITGS